MWKCVTRAEFVRQLKLAPEFRRSLCQRENVWEAEENAKSECREGGAETLLNDGTQVLHCC